MCFDHFMLWATCQEGSAELIRCSSFLCFIFFCGVDFYTELEGLGYIKPKGTGCVRDASTRCASLLAPECLCMSICTLERMRTSSPLRGELHAGMAEG